MKSILDPDFKYRSSDNTNVAELFDRVRRRSPSPTRTFVGSVTDLHVPYVARPLRHFADQPIEESWWTRLAHRLCFWIPAVGLLAALIFHW